jgi:hypothetical protein
MRDGEADVKNAIPLRELHVVPFQRADRHKLPTATGQPLARLANLIFSGPPSQRRENHLRLGRKQPAAYSERKRCWA